VFDFPGGLFAVVASIDADDDDRVKTMQYVQDWIRQSGVFEERHGDDVYHMGTMTTPPDAKEMMGYHQMDLYFPIKTRAE
jgi:hypothetical protein